MDWHLSLLPTFPKTLNPNRWSSNRRLFGHDQPWSNWWIRRSVANALSIETMGSRTTPCASLWIGLNSANLETRESLACHRVSRSFRWRGRNPSQRRLFFDRVGWTNLWNGRSFFDARKNDLVKVFNDGYIRSGRWRCRWTNTRARISENSSFVSFAFVGREPTYKPSIKLSKPCLVGNEKKKKKKERCAPDVK